MHSRFEAQIIMAKGHTVPVYAFISISICTVLQAFTPSGYEGCFRVLRWDLSNLNIEKSDANTGENCKRRCTKIELRYAGTGGRDGTYCACFDDLSRYNSSTECKSICPGNFDEICGGHFIMSVYDTWKPVTERTTIQTQQTEMSTRVTTVTTTPKSVTEGWSSSTTIKPSTSNEANDIRNSKQTTQASLSTTFNNQKERSLSAVYITVPVVLVIIFSISVTVFLLWRRTHKKDTTNNTRTSSAMVNPAYIDLNDENGSPPQYSELNVPQDQYAEIHLDTEGAEEKANTEYNTIDMKQSKCREETNEYNHLTGKPVQFTDTSYAHMDPSKIIIMGPSVSPYSNTSTAQTTVNGIASESDYNRLQTWAAEVKDDARDRDNSEEDPAYDHAAAGGDGSGQDTQPDDYSHLNQICNTNNEQQSGNESASAKYHDPNTSLNNAHGYEKVIAGTPHYFVLEKCHNESPRSETGPQAFKDYEEDKDNGSYNHNYLILEKQE